MSCSGPIVPIDQAGFSHGHFIKIQLLHHKLCCAAVLFTQLNPCSSTATPNVLLGSPKICPDLDEKLKFLVVIPIVHLHQAKSGDSSAIPGSCIGSSKLMIDRPVFLCKQIREMGELNTLFVSHYKLYPYP